MRSGNSLKKGLLLLFLLMFTFLLVGCDELEDYLEKPQRTLTVDIFPKDAGTVTPGSGTQFEDGTMITLTVTPAHDFEFHGWDGINGHEVHSIMGEPYQFRLLMNGNKYITAVFGEGEYYTLTTQVTPEGAGTISSNVEPDDFGYREGTTVRLTANPGEGYRFSHWSGDLTGSTNPINLNMNANKVVTAHFLALDPEKETGSVTGIISDDITKEPLALAEVKILEQIVTTEEDGTYFLADVETGNQRLTASRDGYLSRTVTIRVEKDRTAVVDVALLPEDGEEEYYQLSIDYFGDGSGTVHVTPEAGELGYGAGTMVTLVAYPDLNSHFSHWEGDLTGSQNPISLTMNQHKNVTAVFQESLTAGSIQGTVMDWDTAEPIGEALVTGGGQEVFTDVDGYYLLDGIASGNQIVTVSKEGYLTASRTVLVDEGETVWLDFHLTASGEHLDEMDRAIALIYDINDSLAQFRNTVENEFTTIGNTMESEAIPYLASVGARMGFIGHVLEECFGELDVDDPDRDDWERDEDYWTWNGEIEDESGIHSIRIRITNLQEVFSHDELENTYYLDLTDALFEYDHTYSGDPNFHWFFSFYLDGWEWNQVEWVFQEIDEEGEEYKEVVVITYPLVGEAFLSGSLIDSLQLEEEPAMEEVSLDLYLGFDFTEDDENYLAFNGFFSSRVLKAQGNFWMDLTPFTFTEEEGLVLDFFLPNYLHFYGDVEVFHYHSQELILGGYGSLQVAIIVGEDLDSTYPEYVMLDGSFYTYQDDVLTLGLYGSLHIDFVDFYGEELSIFFNGSFEREGFYPFDVMVYVEVFSPENIESEFWYTFGPDKYLEGTLQLDGGIISLKAADAYGITILLKDLDYESSGEVLGYVYGSDEKTVLGEVLLIDYQVVVLFPNGVLIGFFI